MRRLSPAYSHKAFKLLVSGAVVGERMRVDHERQSRFEINQATEFSKKKREKPRFVSA